MKDQINTDITGVNEALTTEDPEKIKEAIERLKNSSMEIGKAIYANQEGGDAAPEAETTEEPKPEENTEEKKEEEPKKEEEKKWVVWCKSNCGLNFQKASRGHLY